MADPELLGAIALHRQGRLDEAASRYEAFLRDRPGDAEALYYLSVLRSAQGRLEEALGLARAAVDRAPHAVELRVQLGSLYAALRRHPQAILEFTAALSAAPAHPKALNNLGSVLFELGRYEEALDRFVRATQADPAYADALYNAGRTLLEVGRPREAIAYLERALVEDPSAAAFSTLGNAHWELGDAAAAQAFYERALQADPGHAETHANRSNVMTSFGRFDEARASLERAIALDPNRPAFYRALFGLGPVAAGDPAVTALERLAERAHEMSYADAMALHFALAKAYGDRGDHAASFDRLAAGNALVSAHEPYDEAQTLQSFERLADGVTPASFAALASAGFPSDRPIVIVGMPRSGTTLVEQILASHPDVYAAGELTEFEEAQRAVTGADVPPPSVRPEQIAAIGRRYAQRLAALCPGAPRVTDKMPGNFRLLPWIALALPHAHLIHVSRDPLDTCVSIFSQQFTRGHAYGFDLGTLGRYYRAYERLMERWRALLPAGRLLEVRYEELVDDFDAQARRIVEHCALPWNDACTRFYETERAVKTASATQVRQPLYRSSVGRAAKYGTKLAPLVEALAKN